MCVPLNRSISLHSAGTIALPVTELLLIATFFAIQQEDTGARVRVCDQSDNCVERAIIISAGSAADSSPAEAQAQLEHAMLLVYRAVLHPVTEESVAQLMTQPIDEPADTPTEQRLLIHRSLTG